MHHFLEEMRCCLLPQLPYASKGRNQVFVYREYLPLPEMKEESAEQTMEQLRQNSCNPIHFTICRNIKI